MFYAYIGCFTTRPRASGKGISVYRVERPDGPWSLSQILETPANPGCLAYDGRNTLYASHGDIGKVSSYRVDPRTGTLAPLNEQATSGDNAPHLTIDPSGRCVVVAHGPGIAVFPIAADGRLAPLSDSVIPPGESGPYRHEQKGGAHPHQVLFDPSGRFLAAPDKGVDRVHVYRVDAVAGKLIAHQPGFVKCRYGAGPRHIAFHPTQPYAYVVNELDSTVTAYRWDREGGVLQPLQVLPTTPSTFTGDNTGAEIAAAASGRFVYISNRGHDSMATFAVDANTGMLSALDWVATQGRKPRFFTFDPGGDYCYVSHEDGNSVVALRIDHASGRLTHLGEVAQTGTPTCIAIGGDR